MSLKEKRKRSANWEAIEKELLIDLVKEKLDIIESKVASPNAHKVKKLAWAEILRKFNFMNNKEIVKDEIVTQWRNMKNQAKKAESSFRREMKATGGGPPPESPSPEDMEIINLLPNEFIIDNNVYDSDNIYQKLKTSEVKPAETTICESQIFPTLEENTQLKSPTRQNLSVLIEEPQPGTSYASESSFVLSKDTKTIKKKKVKPQHDRRDTDVLLLMKKEKEEKILHEAMEHNLRMQILQLEKEYWLKKIQKLDGE